jgi:hypothetical protein
MRGVLPTTLLVESTNTTCFHAGGEVSRREKMLYSGTDPESYITEYTNLRTSPRLSYLCKSLPLTVLVVQHLSLTVSSVFSLDSSIFSLPKGVWEPSHANKKMGGGIRKFIFWVRG